ncbi:MAG: hypothetical protein MUF84_15080 [Anaerolineae bacterium]|jgi:hypothetical protein|nr:hypothetical protein [Anaerolineae bacterium]
MKAKLTLVIALCILLSSIALPVLAEDSIAMWVSRARLAYVGRSSTGPDAVVGLIHVRDANLQMVDGATVTATWTTPDGRVQQTAVTAFQGIAEFRIWAGRGTYTLCVDGVTKDGWLYAPSLDRGICPTFRVP